MTSLNSLRWDTSDACMIMAWTQGFAGCLSLLPSLAKAQLCHGDRALLLVGHDANQLQPSDTDPVARY